MSADESDWQVALDDWLAIQEATEQQRRRHRQNIILGSAQTALGLGWLLSFTFGDHSITFLVWGIGWLALGVTVLVSAIIRHWRTGQAAPEAH